jgi:sugar/nucleoside kinase (ribokinase family)
MDGGFLLLCGSFLTDRLTADYPALFNWAKQQNVAIALDPGWPVEGWTERELGRARNWLAATSHLLVNELEATALTGTSRLHEALPALASWMPTSATVVIKTGPKGAYALRNGVTHHAAAPDVPVIDTIGAGDVFNAGYLLAMAEGATLPIALETGVEVASRAISTSPRRYERRAVR